jgi:hypothetical protein
MYWVEKSDGPMKVQKGIKGEEDDGLSAWGEEDGLTAWKE